MGVDVKQKHKATQIQLIIDSVDNSYKMQIMTSLILWTLTKFELQKLLEMKRKRIDSI